MQRRNKKKSLHLLNSGDELRRRKIRGKKKMVEEGERRTPWGGKKNSEGY